MSTATQPVEGPAALELTREEARGLFDREARRLLGISGPEFVHLWDADELDGDDDRVIELWMILPFGR